MNKKKLEYENEVSRPAREARNTAITAVEAADRDKPWLKDIGSKSMDDIGNLVRNPAINKLKKSLGRLKGSEATKGAGQIMKAMINDPTIFDNMPPFKTPPYPDGQQVPIANSALKKWWRKNIGMPNGNGSWGRQVQNMLLGISSSGNGDFKAGLQKTFGTFAEDYNKQKADYDKQVTTATTKIKDNPWGGKWQEN